jgi:7,8-dihydro-6-hydroxymethylpterin-pyrophosphokinase
MPVLDLRLEGLALVPHPRVDGNDFVLKALLEASHDTRRSPMAPLKRLN